VSPLTFSQPARRNLVAPIVIAIVALVIAGGLVVQFTPHSIADVTVPHTAVYAAHTVFKGETIVVAGDRAQDDLYVVASVHIENRLRLPLFIKDFTATVTPANPDGSPGEPITTSAAQKTDLPNLFTTFPAVKTLADEELKAPLLRETEIDPGQSADGLLFLHFPLPQKAWDTRKSASISIDTYHQGSIVVTIPPAQVPK
jgi:hypothetical protein